MAGCPWCRALAGRSAVQARGLCNLCVPYAAVLLSLRPVVSGNAPEIRNKTPDEGAPHPLALADGPMELDILRAQARSGAIG